MLAWIFYILARLYLSFNFDGGSTLELSDGSKWQINPEDTDKTSLWVLPAEIEISTSKDVAYPNYLYNVNTKQQVKAKKM